MKIVSKISWSLRRLRLKIPIEALVLEVGSGGNPYPRSNVLVDAYEDTQERHWEKLVSDRPTILASGEKLPFKDKVFDYVIAAHVLEHSPDPARFLSELERVAKAGYIETPDAFMERINPYKDHRLEVTKRDEKLYIRKKAAWISDPEVVELYEARAKKIITRETIPQHAEEFHMRYFWQNRIEFSIINPNVDATWEPPIDPLLTNSPAGGLKNFLRNKLLVLLRRMFSQNSKNASLDILSLMRCPKCRSDALIRSTSIEVLCEGCNSRFMVAGNIFKFATTEN